MRLTLVIFACGGRVPVWAVNKEKCFDVSSFQVVQQLSGPTNKVGVGDGEMETQAKTKAARWRWMGGWEGFVLCIIVLLVVRYASRQLFRLCDRRNCVRAWESEAELKCPSPTAVVLPLLCVGKCTVVFLFGQ